MDSFSIESMNTDEMEHLPEQEEYPENDAPIVENYMIMDGPYRETKAFFRDHLPENTMYGECLSLFYNELILHREDESFNRLDAFYTQWFEDDRAYLFLTECISPIAWLKDRSKHYPNVAFYLTYGCRLDHTSGQLVIKNGEILEETHAFNYCQYWKTTCPMCNENDTDIWNSIMDMYICNDCELRFHRVRTIANFNQSIDSFTA